MFNKYMVWGTWLTFGAKEPMGQAVVQHHYLKPSLQGGPNHQRTSLNQEVQEAYNSFLRQLSPLYPPIRPGVASPKSAVAGSGIMAPPHSGCFGPRCRCMQLQVQSSPPWKKEPGLHPPTSVSKLQMATDPIDICLGADWASGQMTRAVHVPISHFFFPILPLCVFQRH